MAGSITALAAHGTVILADNQITEKIRGFGTNWMTWASYGAIILGILCVIVGAYRFYQYAKQDNNERQQKKYSLGWTLGLLAFGIFMVAGGVYAMFTQPSGFKVNPQDIYGNNTDTSITEKGQNG